MYLLIKMYLSTNYKILNSNYILHKEGIIINIQTLNIIYPKSKQNIIMFEKKYYNMACLMLDKFYNIDIIHKNNICHIDDNIYNNNINNILYLNINYNDQNLYLCNDQCYYYFIIEKYNLNFNLIERIPNIKYNNFNKHFILNLFTYPYVCDTLFYWKLTIKKVYHSELNNVNLYYNIPNSVYYLSYDKSHIINKNKKKILPIYKSVLNKYYSALYDSKIHKYTIILLDYYDFLILDSTIFNQHPNELF